MSRSNTFALIIALIVIVFANNGCKQQRQKKYPPDFRHLPMQLGSWKGEENKKAAKNLSEIVQAIYVVERLYHNPDGAEVSVGIDVFLDWDMDRHDPILCYKAAGWEPLGQTVEQIRINKDKAIPVNLSRWRKVIPQVQILYWYQLEDKILFHKEDLKKIPSEILNNKTPARLVKVMLAITEGNIEESKDNLKNLAKEIGKWIEEASENVDTNNL